MGNNHGHGQSQIDRKNGLTKNSIISRHNHLPNSLTNILHVKSEAL